MLLRQKQRKHQIVSRLGDLRRRLIELTYDDIVSVDSQVFFITYLSLEMLIRVRYLELHHLPPRAGRFLDQIDNKVTTDRAIVAKRELEALIDGPNKEIILPFYQDFVDVFVSAFVRNRVLFILNLLARLGGVHLSRYLRAMRQYVTGIDRLNTLLHQNG